MKYQHRQNGKVMEILKQDDKKGTMLIQFEDGKSSSITTGTFKRWYKKIEETSDEVAPLIDLDNLVTDEEAEVNGMITGDEALEQAVVDPDEAYVAEVMRQKAELGIECSPITEVEIIEQAKQKAKDVKKPKVKKDKTPKKQANPEVPAILDYITKKLGKQVEIFTPEKAPKVRALKFEGHMFARLNLSTSCIYLCCRSKAIKEVPDKTVNHMFDAMFEIKDLSNTGLIDSLLQESLEYQKNKKTKKEEK